MTFFCERGISIRDGTPQHALDLSAIPMLRTMTHFPLSSTPSHGDRPLAHGQPWRWRPPPARRRAHHRGDNDPCPRSCDGPQLLTPRLSPTTPPACGHLGLPPRCSEDKTMNIAVSVGTHRRTLAKVAQGRPSHTVNGYDSSETVPVPRRADRRHRRRLDDERLLRPATWERVHGPYPPGCSRSCKAVESTSKGRARARHCGVKRRNRTGRANRPR
jgi:hypothetical protein